jgi:hypothetical protein
MSPEGSEWMKIMLEEIARKKAEQEQIRAEELMRAEEHRRDDRRNTRSK